MEIELALRTIGYLIGYYKTHEETIINSQEIEAINYILDENERLQTQLKKQQEIIDKVSFRLEYFLIGNLKYQSSQEEFIKLLNIL